MHPDPMPDAARGAPTLHERGGPLLTVTDVHKRFKRRDVLRGCNLSVEPGELVGIVGENGSGKSTLLRVMVGLLAPDSGRVAIEGTFGYCPQEPVIFDGLSMAENIRYFSAAYGISAREGRARSLALMERLNCAAHDAQPVGVLSGGTRQKLNLILALLHAPRLLILDEPYQGFDYDSYRAFWSLAQELAGDGQAILMVSHLLHDESELSRIYRIQEGIVHDG